MCIPGLEDLKQSHKEFAARGVELAVVMSTTEDESLEIIRNLGLPYPLYSDPSWQVFEDYGTGHILFAPKQSWVILDRAGIVRWVWRSGQGGSTGRVPMPREILAEVDRLFPR